MSSSQPRTLPVPASLARRLPPLALLAAALSTPLVACLIVMVRKLYVEDVLESPSASPRSATSREARPRPD